MGSEVVLVPAIGATLLSATVRNGINSLPLYSPINQLNLVSSRVPKKQTGLHCFDLQQHLVPVARAASTLSFFPFIYIYIFFGEIKIFLHKTFKVKHRSAWHISEKHHFITVMVVPRCLCSISAPLCGSASALEADLKSVIRTLGDGLASPQAINKAYYDKSYLKCSLLCKGRAFTTLGWEEQHPNNTRVQAICTASERPGQGNTRYVSKYRPLGATAVSVWIMLNTFNGHLPVWTENRDFFLSFLVEH